MRQQISEHAAAEYPRECCGLVVSVDGQEQYVPCNNLSDEMGHFAVDPHDYVAADELGEIVAVVHSHPDGPLRASVADQVGCNQSQLPWHIISWPADEMISIQPNTEVLPLLGREFSHGVVDCLTAITDFYACYGIHLQQYQRHDKWWEKGQTLYDDNIQNEAFDQIEDITQLQPGDLIFMQLAASVVNHSAVYLGNGIIYHHLPNRLSGREVYRGFYQKITRSVWRHRQWQQLDCTVISLENLDDNLS